MRPVNASINSVSATGLLRVHPSANTVPLPAVLSIDVLVRGHRWVELMHSATVRGNRFTKTGLKPARKNNWAIGSRWNLLISLEQFHIRSRGDFSYGSSQCTYAPYLSTD